MSRVVPDFAVALVLVTGWVLLGVATTSAALAGFASKDGSSSSRRTGWRRRRRAPDCSIASGCYWYDTAPRRRLADRHAAADRAGAHAAGAVEHGARLAHLAAGAGRGRGAALAERGRAAALLGLGTWVGSGPLMFAFLNGSGTCLLAWGLLPEASRSRFSWVGWLVAAAPLAIGVALGSLLVLGAMLRPEPVARLPLRRVSLQVAMLGPVAPREMGTIAILVRHASPAG